MHRVSYVSAQPQEEWTYANHRFVKGGKWPPKTKFCTTSSMSKQPTTRANCAPLIEHSVNNSKDLDEVYQIGNYLTTWCSHAEDVLDDLGVQSEQILSNLRLLREEQEADKQRKEEKARKKREKERRKREHRTPHFSMTMEPPSLWEFEEPEEEPAESSVQAEETEKKISKGKEKVFEKTYESSPLIQKPKSELATLEDAAKKFPSFIRPSLQKAHIFRDQYKYPRIEEDLFSTSASGYVLDLERSKNPAESIRIWIGYLYQMQSIPKLNNESIFYMAEKRMAGIVYDWWMAASAEERMNVCNAGLTTLELLMKTQIVPEPTDEKK